MPKSLKELKHFTTESPHVRAEKKGRRIMSQLLGVSLMKKKLEIFGRMQEFDLVNEQEKIVGDVKRYVTKTTSPTSEIDRMSAYVWFMENLSNQAEANGEKSLSVLAIGKSSKPLQRDMTNCLVMSKYTS